jgi:tetratricopeptide (TPR) repeat protein
MCLNNLGNVARPQGDCASARALHEESLTISRELGDSQGIATCLNNLGSVMYDQGDYGAALALHAESLSIRRELGDRQGIAASLYRLGNVAKGQGDYGAARSLYEESLEICREVGDRQGVVHSLEGLAAAFAAQDQPALAARLWGAAEMLRETLGAPLPPNERDAYDQQIRRVRSASGAEAFAAAWQEGRSLTPDQAMRPI